jgi:hypothetical protein
MEISEKKEPENNNNISQSATLDSSSTTDIIDKESEERQARELKAGLHPLKVPNPSLSLSLSHTLSYASLLFFLDCCDLVVFLQWVCVIRLFFFRIICG